MDLLDEQGNPKDPLEQNSRFTGRWHYIEKSNQQVDAMDSVRAAIDGTELGKGGNAFAYGSNFLDYE